MLVSKQSLDLLDAMLDLEIKSFVKDKPSALFDKQVAIYKLKVELISLIKETPDSVFTIKNTTATGDYDMCISIKNCTSPTRMHEIRIASNGISFTKETIRL